MRCSPTSSRGSRSVAEPVSITLLTREACEFCHDAEEIIARLSGEFALEVTRIDIDSEDGQQRAVREGILFPPGILLGERGFSYGRPSEKKLRKELQRRCSS